MNLQDIRTKINIDYVQARHIVSTLYSHCTWAMVRNALAAGVHSDDAVYSNPGLDFAIQCIMKTGEITVRVSDPDFSVTQAAIKDLARTCKTDEELRERIKASEEAARERFNPLIDREYTWSFTFAPPSKTKDMMEIIMSDAITGQNLWDDLYHIPIKIIDMDKSNAGDHVVSETLMLTPEFFDIATLFDSERKHIMRAVVDTILETTESPDARMVLIQLCERNDTRFVQTYLEAIHEESLDQETPRLIDMEKNAFASGEVSPYETGHVQHQLPSVSDAMSRLHRRIILPGNLQQSSIEGFFNPVSGQIEHDPDEDDEEDDIGTSPLAQTPKQFNGDHDGDFDE